jgi:predicted permease
VRQLLVESVVRAFAGAALGLLAAQAATRFLVANAPAGVHGLEQAGLRPAVVLAAAIVALAAGLLSGWPLALSWSAGDRLPPPDGGRSIGDPRTSRLRFGLAAGQVAMAAMLLVLVGLTVRSYVRLSSTSPGFEARGLLTLEYRLPRNKYPSTAAQARFHEQVLTGVRTLPGVVAAAGVRALPFSGNGSTTAFRVPGTGIRGEASANAVSPGYFAAMGIPLLGGRVFERTDPAIAIVVSRALAERAWAGRDPLGRQLRFDDADLTATVVGVVGDVRHRDLTDAGGTVYVPQDRHPAVFNTLIVRTAVPPLSLADAVRHAIREVDPDQPVWKVRTMETLVEQSLVARRFLLQLVAFFGVSAGVLSVVGLYGVIAVDVARRRQEIGLRMALGATRGAVLIMILRSGMRVSVAGIGCGLLGALTAAQLVQRFLFGISARDPLTFGLVGVLLAAAALAACWLPARRAMRVDPVLPLRAA